MPSPSSFRQCHKIFYLTKGFTLIELLTVIAILAIMATLAIPSLLTTYKNQEASMVRVKLETFIRNGRQYSLMYQQPVVLCVADITEGCVAKNGVQLLSFIDKNNNHTFEASEDVMLDRIAVTPRYGYLDMRVSLNKPYLQLTAINAQALGSMGHIKYCPNC